MQIRLIQVDTRDPYSSMQGPMRTWQGGSSHGELHHRYVTSNPPPPRRPYWSVSALYNALQCRKMGWRYEYAHVPEPPGRHPSWVKIRHLLHCWPQYGDDEIVVLIDTDAWVRDAEGFQHLLRTRLGAPGAATRYLAAGEPGAHEVLNHGADAMNGGFMCFVKDERVRQFLQAAWDLPDRSEEARKYLVDWPWEQATLSRAYRADEGGCKAWMEILPTPMCNTPAGTHVAHCWYKDLTYDLVVDDLLSHLAQDVMQIKKPTIEFVVARYEEDVAWVNDWVPYVERITIYDKSPVPMASPHPKVRVVALPNVGREGHTYAHHLHECGGELCDTVVFTQGRFEDHLSRQEFDAMVGGKERPTSQGLDIPWSRTPMQHFGWSVERNHQTTQQAMQPASMTMAKFYLQFVADDLVPEDQVRWWPGAIFAASADNLKRHPRERYAAIRDQLAVGSNPETGHIMERFWRALVVPPNY